jgi:formylglycine-generating enzyme required for sulfatase activity
VKNETGTAGSAGACRVALLATRRPFCNDLVAAGVDGPLLVLVPGGEFQMGGTQTAEEQPPHPVRIARPFAMSVHEISSAEFLRYCQAAQSTCPKQRWPGDDYPVVDVSWRDADAYVRWLSQVTGQHYRLPSEAEWEYAARAGSTTAYPGGDELLITDARFSAEKTETTPLPNSDRSINRNRFRLANMVGNVREWVQDAWQTGYLGAPADGTARPGGAGERAVRGGSYADPAGQLRSSARAHLPTESRDAVTGFRVVRDLTE